MPYRLEVPIFGHKSPSKIAASGAARLELNREGSYGDGGLTPSTAEVAAGLPARAGESWAVRVMIRPRGPPKDGGTDFYYSEAEYSAMRQSIEEFKQSALLDASRGDGFVFGILTGAQSDSNAGAEVEHEGLSGTTRSAVDIRRCKELVQLAAPLPCVFHRAFDELFVDEDDHPGTWEQGLEDIIACGFDGVLTSGGPGNAPDAKNTVALDKVIKAAGDRIEIIVGGGVRDSNIRELTLGLAAASENARIVFHSSCRDISGDADGVNYTSVSKLSQFLMHVTLEAKP